MFKFNLLDLLGFGLAIAGAGVTYVNRERKYDKALEKKLDKQYGCRGNNYKNDEIIDVVFEEDDDEDEEF